MPEGWSWGPQWDNHFRQQALFDPGPVTSRHKPSYEEEEPWEGAAQAEYSEKYSEKTREGRVPNPLPKKKQGRAVIAALGSKAEEWVPTERLTSNQETVTPEAVDHLSQHADFLSMEKLPVLHAYGVTGQGEHYDVINGNHRANAALNQGRLFIPANVYRDRRA